MRTKAARPVTRLERSFLPTASSVGFKDALHPCVAYPDLYILMRRLP